MGIFSFLSRDADIEDIEPTPEVPQKEPKGKLPDLRKEMPVEVLDEDGQIVISGLITEVNNREITLGRHPGGLSFKICEIGSSVTVQGRDNRLQQFYIRATVAESSRINIKLTDLEQEERENVRDTFRLTLNAPIAIYYHTDERMTRPEACTLVDISVGGCCISSEYLHGEGEVLRIRIKLEDYAPMDLVGEVIRVTEYGRKDFRYGILFAELTKEEHEAMTKMLFNLQTGNRQEHSRSPKTGGWG